MMGAASPCFKPSPKGNSSLRSGSMKWKIFPYLSREELPLG